MPLVRIDLRRGKPTAYIESLLDGIYSAMRESFAVPEDDRFMLITEHDSPNFSFSPTYLGIARSENLVIIQLTVNNTRQLAQKQALFHAIAANLTRAPGLRPEDIFINLVEVVPENWSFGHGIAQYAERPS